MDDETELPEEIITSEILPKLPVKTLIRFKSVSKHYKTLISTPQFAKFHLNRQLSNPNPNPNFQQSQSLFVATDDNSFYTLDYEDTKEGFIKEGLIKLQLGTELSEQVDIEFYNQIGVYVIGSCHGLVCLDFGGSYLCVWNPATGESRKIENPPSYRRKESVWGFGYVSSINDYKIVSVSQKLHSHKKGAHTLVVKGSGGAKGDWGRVDVVPDGYNLDSRTYSGVLIEERLFWRMINGVGVSCIVGFDVDIEGFDEVEVPEWIAGLKDFMLFAMGGCLSVWWREGESRVEIATLKEFGDSDSWVKLYSFACESFYCCDLLGSARFGKVFVVTLDGLVLFFDLNKEFPAHIELLGLASKDVINHVPSLVSPFGICESRS